MGKVRLVFGEGYIRPQVGEKMEHTHTSPIEATAVRVWPKNHY